MTVNTMVVCSERLLFLSRISYESLSYRARKNRMLIAIAQEAFSAHILRFPMNIHIFLRR